MKSKIREHLNLKNKHVSKKVLIGAIVLANVFLACKKEDRTCTCTVSKIGTSTTRAALTFSIPIVGNVPVIDTSFVTTVSDVFTYDRVIKKVTKKQGEYNCYSYTEPYKNITTNDAPPLTLITTEEGTKSYDCKLK